MRKYLIAILLLGGGLLAFFLTQKNSSQVIPDSNNEIYKKPTYSSGYQKYRMASRANKDGKIPMDALFKAKEHIRQMQPVTRDAGIWEWEWLGPSNIGGRIRSILLDPNDPDVIWIGAVAGGIWKSSDGGATWTAINDFMTNLVVGSLAYDPSTTTIMYAATGEGYTDFEMNDALPGAGILKSTDNGITWTQLASTNNDNFKYVNRLAAHPNPDSAGVLFAVTSLAIEGGTNGVWKTEDGGQTWNLKFTPGDRAYDIRYDPNNHNELMLAGHGFFYLSDDYGETWTEQTTGAAGKLPVLNDRCEGSFSLSNAQRIYVSMDRNGGELWSSSDNGVTWSCKNTGSDYLHNGGWYANCLWVCPTNSNRVVVGGLDLWRSMDGGSTLTKISDWHDYHNGGEANSAHADQHFIVEAVDWNTTTNPEVYFANDGGIQKTNNIWTVSENSGWINLANSSLGITEFYGGAAAHDGSIIVGGSQDNDKLRYRSSGAWSGRDNWFQATTGDGGYTAINYNNTDIIYGEYTYLRILKSTDGGDTYSLAINGLLNAGDSRHSLFIAPFSMDPNNPARLVAGGTSIYLTTDHADNWLTIRHNIGWKCSAIDIDYNNGDIIWVGYAGGMVSKSSYDGVSYTWVDLDTNGIGLPDRYVTDIAINPNNSNEVYVTFGGYYNDNVWYTNDSGLSWQNRSGTAPNNLPALQVNTVRVHPQNSNWVYIGTDLGMFASEDKGLHWNVTTNNNHGGVNDGPVNTEVSELFWQGDEFLIAATHGRGMFRTACPPYKIYVDSNAAPGGNGSQTHPFKTVAEAVAVAGPGATISIEAGTYDESEIITFQNEGYIIAPNGGVLIK